MNRENITILCTFQVFSHCNVISVVECDIFTNVNKNVVSIVYLSALSSHT